MTTKTPASQVELTGGSTLATVLAYVTYAADYGAAAAGTATANTAAINAAIVAATGTTGHVVVAPGVAYTESSLVIPADVIILVYGASGLVTYLTSDRGTSLPITPGGVAIKSKGNSGVALRTLDYGVAASPVLQLTRDSTGAIAHLEHGFSDLVELTGTVNPAAGKARLYAENVAGKTTLFVKFSSGAAIQLAVQV